jgi:hypothetical protein
VTKLKKLKNLKSFNPFLSKSNLQNNKLNQK